MIWLLATLNSMLVFFTRSWRHVKRKRITCTLTTRFAHFSDSFIILPTVHDNLTTIFNDLHRHHQLCLFFLVRLAAQKSAGIICKLLSFEDIIYMNSCKIIFYAWAYNFSFLLVKSKKTLQQLYLSLHNLLSAFSSEKKLSKKGLAASSAADGKTSISKTIDWISLKNKSSIFDIIDGRGEGKENIKNIKGWRFFRDESI